MKNRFNILALSFAFAALAWATPALASGGAAPVPNAIPADELLSMRPQNDDWYETGGPEVLENSAASTKIEYEFQLLVEMATAPDTVVNHKHNLVNFIKTSTLASLPLPKDPLEQASNAEAGGGQLSQLLRQLNLAAADRGVPADYPDYWKQIIDLAPLTMTGSGPRIAGASVDPNFVQALLELSVDTYDALGNLKVGSCRYIRSPLLLATLLKIRISGADVAAWHMDCNLFARYAKMIKTLEVAYESSYGNMAFASCAEPYFLAFSLFDQLGGVETHSGYEITYSSSVEQVNIWLANAGPQYQSQISYQRAYDQDRGTFAQSSIVNSCGNN